MSARLSSRVDEEFFRSLSRDRRPGYGTVRARSGSRERMEDRVQRSEERGRRADSSGPRARIPRPSPSPTGTASSHDVAVIGILYSILICAWVSKFLPTILQGHGLLALTQLLTSRTGNGGRERQNSKSRFPIFFPSAVDVGSAAYSVSCVCQTEEGTKGHIDITHGP